MLHCAARAICGLPLGGDLNRVPRPAPLIRTKHELNLARAVRHYLVSNVPREPADVAFQIDITPARHREAPPRTTFDRAQARDQGKRRPPAATGPSPVEIYDPAVAVTPPDLQHERAVRKASEVIVPHRCSIGRAVVNPHDPVCGTVLEAQRGCERGRRGASREPARQSEHDQSCRAIHCSTTGAIRSRHLLPWKMP